MRLTILLFICLVATSVVVPEVKAQLWDDDDEDHSLVDLLQSFFQTYSSLHSEVQQYRFLKARYDLRKQKVKTVFEYATYDKAVVTATNFSNVPAGLMSPDVEGAFYPQTPHLAPSGTYEYFWLTGASIFPFPRAGPGQFVKIGSSRLSHFSDNKDISFVRVTLGYNLLSNGSLVSNLTYVCLFGWDSQNRINKYECNIIQFDDYFKYSGQNLSDPIYQQQLIGFVCNEHQNWCNGSLRQYDNFTDCVQKLSTKPFYYPGSNMEDTVMCRTTHARILKYEPALHCIHVGFNHTDGQCQNQIANGRFPQYHTSMVPEQA